ncbi:MAG: YgiW/YdeI family stress tolerance OB fold protein [Saezia sp.]
MLRQLIITSTFIFFSITGAIAYAQGGFQGPSANPTLVTVEQAKSASDDTMVLLKGYVIEHVRHDHYLFKDDTGTIRVDIDHRKWAGQTITPEMLVEIWGEVDKDWNSVEIDVKSIRILQ